MGKKTIIHLIYVLDLGGTENNLIRLLPDLEHHYKNVVIALKGHGAVAESLKKIGIPVYWLDFDHIGHLPRMFFRFRKLVRQYRPDILSTYLPVSDLFGRIAGRLLGIPKIICNLRSTHNSRRYRKVILADFLTRRLVDHYTINSPTILDHYAALYPYKRAQFTTIPNRIDFKIFRPATNHLRVSKNLILTYVGNFHPMKGHRTLLEAFELLYKNHHQLELWLVGDGQEKANLYRQVNHYFSKKYIHFLGKRNDVADLLRETDIFAFPSLFEGQSNALLEAMSTECAIIASDIPENRALIQDGISGLLVPPGDPKAFAQGLGRLIKNASLRHSLGKSARDFVEKEFDPKTILEQWRAVYE